MTVQPKPAAITEKKKPADKKESIYGNIGAYQQRGSGNGTGNSSVRVARDRPAATTATAAAAASATAAVKPAQDLFNTGRDSWLNMPKDLGPKLNRSKPAPAAYKSSRSRREQAAAVATDSDLSVLEQLNRAADEILKAVDGYTDDEQQPPAAQQQRPQQQQQRRRPEAVESRSAVTSDASSDAKLKNRKKAARLLQRANSREALLHLDGASSSDEDAAAQDEQPHCRVKPKMQRKAKTSSAQQQQHNSNSYVGVAAKTTASFTKK